MHRVLTSLYSCQPLGSRPNCIPKARLSGVKLRGLTYEKRVGAHLRSIFPKVYSGQWFQYVDATGGGYCQPDHFIVLKNGILCIECKLTETPVGFAQIRQLYRPILEKHYGLPVVGVQAARHIRSHKFITDIKEALTSSRDVLWHHLT
jgi:hypothetical protein